MGRKNQVTSKTTGKNGESLEDDALLISELQGSFSDIKDELRKVIIGQDFAIEHLFLCMLCRGHALLMGVPGLAKTLLVNSIAQEKRVTVAGKIHQLKEPFFVLATQNPIEQEGTYPLPEAQIDRFMFLINLDYPERTEELSIAKETTANQKQTLNKVISGRKMIAYQSLVDRVPVPDNVYEFAVDLVRRTRPSSKESPEWLKNLVQWGAGPRAVQFLVRGAKARTVLHGNFITSSEDMEAIAETVLNHRILTSFQARSEGVTSSEVVSRLIREYKNKLG